MALTEEQIAAINDALARGQQEQPRERLRTLAQGATFGTADEIEARARSIATGRPYAEVLQEIRGNLEAYRQARPGEALAYEIGGAALPAIATLGTSAPASVGAGLGRAALTGALEGGAYAFGTGEGGFANRLSRVPGGAAGGAVGGAVGGAAVRGAGSMVNVLTDATRRLVGRRGSSIVENEIQRLAQQTGKTPDELAADIMDGRILAENETIRAAVRAIRSQGGEASTIIGEALQRRPAQTREQAMTELRRYLSDVEAPSALQAQRRTDEAARAAERQAYGQFETMPAPPEVVSQLEETLRRVPSATKEVEMALRAETGDAPFFTLTEEGQVVFNRDPTVGEAERIRRAVSNRATALYRESMGGAGEAVSGVGEALRDVLDMGVPELATARGQAAAVRANRDAFEAGQKSLTGDVNERLMEFSRLTDPEAIQSYRAGLMAALEARAATGSRASMIRNLTNEEAKEGMILRAVFPQDQLNDAINALGRAAESQAAASRIIGQSATAETLMEANRQGLGIGAATMAEALGGSPVAIASLAQNLVSRLQRGLNDAERARVAQILVSEDPELVRRAIVDESGMAMLQERIRQIVEGAVSGATGAAGTGGAMAVAPFSEGILGSFMSPQ
jgi:hypothetical protein